MFLDFAIHLRNLKFRLIEIFNLDQEDIFKGMIRNNSEIVNRKIIGDFPIHYAAKHSPDFFNKILRN